MIGFYPSDIDLYKLNKKFLYECNPILMNIDHDYIKTIFSNIKLSKFERDRNTKTELFMVGFQNNENITIEVL